ncbi:MAG: Uma2 family endonuclease [Gemmataceae bacterium]|nr:Uma2 family endonuclease [Gemmataceae bacterium]
MSTIVIGEQARIPAWVVDHDSFRRWIYSGDFPERGQFFHLNGELWVNLSMETLSHNKIKQVIAMVLGSFIYETKAGLYVGDRMMLTNLDAVLSAEPDGMFIAAPTLRSGEVVLEQGDESLEVMGTPDMVLEVVSKTSVRKDTMTLPDLYYRAGIREYWLVDSRPDHFRFDIFRTGRRKYRATRKTDGWITSGVFGKSFRLLVNEGREGTSDYRLEMR